MTVRTSYENGNGLPRSKQVIKDLSHFDIKDSFDEIEQFLEDSNWYHLKRRNELISRDYTSLSAKEKKDFERSKNHLEKGVDLLDRHEYSISKFLENYTELSTAYLRLKNMFQVLEKQYIQAKLNSSKHNAEAQEYKSLYEYAMQLAFEESKNQ